jgi:tellurite resistance protein TehA-like permease
MYYATANTNSTTEKPVTSIACYALTGLAITVSALAFWDKGALPTVLMTTAFASVSYLLAGAVNRVADALRAKAWMIAGTAIAMGLVCLCLEAGMTHYGLEQLNRQYDIAPAWALWPMSFGLSIFNVFSQFAFVREIKQTKAIAPVVEKPSTVAEWTMRIDQPIAAVRARRKSKKLLDA